MIRNATVKYPKEENVVIYVDNIKYDIEKWKCKNYYWTLIAGKKVVPSCKLKWIEVFPKMEELDAKDWSTIFSIPFKCARETSIQSFQYKLNHRIVACNKWLFNITIKDSDQCEYCQCIDTIIHFFIECEKVSQFWKIFFKWWNNLAEIKINVLSNELREIIIFGFPSPNDHITVLNYCLLVAKMFIYKQRLFNDNNIDFFTYLVIVKQKMKIEQIICKKEFRPDKFHKFSFIFDNL